MSTELMLVMPDPSLQVVGLAGAGLYMTSYSLLALRFLSGDSIGYFLLNLTAASLVLISLSQSFNAASLVIQLFWIVVSVTSILIRLRRRRPPARLSPLR